MQEHHKGNNYLKRTNGKKNGDILRRDFYNYYKEKVASPLKIKQYAKFLSALLEKYSNEIIKENLILHIAPIGKFRIKVHKHYMFTPEGKKKQSNRVNWKATWDYWHTKYPELTRDQILALEEKKKVLYHTNEHTNGEVGQHYWRSSRFKNADVYEFEATREFSRLLAKTMKDPKREIFYYA